MSPGSVAIALLSALTAASAAWQARALAAAGATPHPLAPGWLVALPASPAALGVAVAVAAVAAALFAVGRAPVVAGLAQLAASTVLVEAHAALAGGPARNLFYGGAATLGWLAGVAFARLRRGGAAPAPDEGAFAEAGVRGVLAATYVSAALSKLLESGAAWLDPAGLRAIVVSQHEVSDTSLLGRYAELVASSGALSTALSAATLAAQLGAVLLLGPPRARAFAAAALLAFHANVLLLTHILYGEPMVLLAVFALPWRRADAPIAPRAGDRRALLAGAGAAAALALGGWLGGARGYTALHHARPTAAPRADPAVAAWLGLDVGDALAGFRVAAIRGPNEGGEVRLELERGDATLVLTVGPAGRHPDRAPPRTRAGWDVRYGKPPPGRAEPPAEAREAALDALAARLR